jgi:histone acetyltransferase 1
MRKLRDELAELRNNRVEEGNAQDDDEDEEGNFRVPLAVVAGARRQPAPPAPDPWVVSALQCMEFCLVQGAEGLESRFHPSFAHQVFGDDETISGYRDLRIVQYYSAASLYCFTDISFAARRNQPTPSPTDLWAALREWHPDDADESEASWRAPSLEALQQHARSDRERLWVPPGEMVHGYSIGDDAFEVWHSTFANERARDYHRRLRVFAIWFIDGARYLDDTDIKWDVFTVFRRRRDGGLTLGGYVTVYPFFAWDGQHGGGRESLEELLQCASPHTGDVWYARRVRVSQVLLLPPLQRCGHGERMLRFLYAWAASQYAPLRDITVEDPSPAFVALRDRVDVQWVMEHNAITEADVKAALAARHTCAAQVERIWTLLCWGRAVMAGDVEEQNRIRVEVKRRLYKEHAADIPDGAEGEDAETRKTILNELWKEEQEQFERVLRKAKYMP